jgi:hypothetical protein
MAAMRKPPHKSGIQKDRGAGPGNICVDNPYQIVDPPPNQPCRGDPLSLQSQQNRNERQNARRHRREQSRRKCEGARCKNSSAPSRQALYLLSLIIPN